MLQVEWQNRKRKTGQDCYNKDIRSQTYGDILIKLHPLHHLSQKNRLLEQTKIIIKVYFIRLAAIFKEFNQSYIPHIQGPHTSANVRHTIQPASVHYSGKQNAGQLLVRRQGQQAQVQVHVHPSISTIDTDLETAAWAEVHHDAYERRLDAGANEPVQVVMWQFLHHVQLFFDGSRHLDVSHRQHLHGDDRALVWGHLDSVWSARPHVIQRFPWQVAEAGEKSMLHMKQTSNVGQAMTTFSMSHISLQTHMETWRTARNGRGAGVNR